MLVCRSVEGTCTPPASKELTPGINKKVTRRLLNYQYLKLQKYTNTNSYTNFRANSYTNSCRRGDLIGTIPIPKTSPIHRSLDGSEILSTSKSPRLRCVQLLLVSWLLMLCLGGAAWEVWSLEAVEAGKIYGKQLMSKGLGGSVCSNKKRVFCASMPMHLQLTSFKHPRINQ